MCISLGSANTFWAVKVYHRTQISWWLIRADSCGRRKEGNTCPPTLPHYQYCQAVQHCWSYYPRCHISHIATLTIFPGHITHTATLPILPEAVLYCRQGKAKQVATDPEKHNRLNGNNTLKRLSHCVCHTLWKCGTPYMNLRRKRARVNAIMCGKCAILVPTL